MAGIALNPALTLTTSLLIAAISILLLLFCLFRKKSAPVRRNSDYPSAFDEYRKQQQASQEDLVRREKGKSFVLTSAEELQAHDKATKVILTRVSDIENKQGHNPTSNTDIRGSGIQTTSQTQPHAGVPRISQPPDANMPRMNCLPGGDLIDQFPDEQHVYRLDPTEKWPSKESAEITREGDQGNNTQQVEYAKVNKKAQPHTVPPLGNVEYANINKKAASDPGEKTQVKHTNIDGQKKVVINLSEVVIEGSGSPSSIQESEQYFALWHTSGPQESKEVPPAQHINSLTAPNRNISAKSTVSTSSDFQDCTEFRRPEPTD